MIIKRKRSILDATMIRKDNGMTDLLYEGWEDELTQEYSPNEDDLGNEASSTREDGMESRKKARSNTNAPGL